MIQRDPIFFSFSLIDEKATRKSLNRDDARSVGQELWTKASLENSISNNYIGRYSRSRSFVAVERSQSNFLWLASSDETERDIQSVTLPPFFPSLRTTRISRISLFFRYFIFFFFSLSELRRNVKRWIKQFSQISRLLR